MDAGRQKSHKRAAVVVPLKNERRGLNRLLTALCRQLSEADEIICVDAGSTDGTWEALRRFVGSNPQVKAFREDGAYPGRARNVAIQHTSAQFIAQIDGGNIPNEQWLSIILDPLLHGRADFVIGNLAIKPVLITLWGCRVDMGRFYEASLFRGPHIRGRSMLHPPAGGAGVAYRRRVWQKAGGFPGWLRTGEDRLFARKLMQQNPRIVFAEEAVIYWEIGSTLWTFLVRRYHYQRISVERWGENDNRRKWISLNIGFIGATAAVIVIPELWVLPATFFCATIVYQTFKSARTYYQRFHRPARFQVWLVLLFMALETFVLPARILGSIRGIFRDNDEHRRHHILKEEYLTLRWPIDVN